MYIAVIKYYLFNPDNVRVYCHHLVSVSIFHTHMKVQHCNNNVHTISKSVKVQKILNFNGVSLEKGSFDPSLLPLCDVCELLLRVIRAIAQGKTEVNWCSCTL